MTQIIITPEPDIVVISETEIEILEVGVQGPQGSGTGGEGTSDHGALTGLSDDDHPQYHNDARGDIRYYTKSAVDTALAGKAASSHTHTASQVTDFADAADGRIAAQKAQNSGLATLDAGGKIPTSQLPALAISETFVVNNESAQLALSAQQGDTAVRTDQNKTYIHNGGVLGTMADWQELLTPTDTVLSVNGQTGAVTLTTSNITEGSNQYFTAARAIAAAITGFVAGAGTVSATDTILQAIQKIVGNIAGLVTGVSSVAGKTGEVTLTTADVAASTDKNYVTNAQQTNIGNLKTGAYVNITVGTTPPASPSVGDIWIDTN